MRHAPVGVSVQATELEPDADDLVEEEEELEPDPDPDEEPEAVTVSYSSPPARRPSTSWPTIRASARCATTPTRSAASRSRSPGG